MPDPALSQGFGQEFMRRGWGEWGGAPFTDLMAAVDAAEQRPDIDATRTAAMGGSFGGYMANWVATQTDRFRAIVTHASLWDLDAFTGHHGRRLLLGEGVGRPAARAEALRAELPAPLRRRDPHADAGHPRRQGLPGADRRGPAALVRPAEARDPVEVPLLPRREPLGADAGQLGVWYETVLAFLAEHVLGQAWERPELV